MCPHSTVQPIVPQYRERSPNPYVGMKQKGETDKDLYDNEPTILAGNREACIYIQESTCVSQPMILKTAVEVIENEQSQYMSTI